jgi:hypothetical protein
MASWFQRSTHVRSACGDDVAPDEPTRTSPIAKLKAETPHRATGRSYAPLAALAVAVLTAGTAAAADTTVEASLRHGVAAIRGTDGEAKRDAQLAHVLVRLRSDRGSTAPVERARKLAIRGFTWTRRGLHARLDFIRNDSGNLPAAVRDSIAADRALKRGAALLRAAGRALGIRIGTLDGY